MAEKLLSEGKTDLIGMVRELIADPRLPEKAMAGAVEEIRPCIGCMQSCIGRRTKGNYITCIHNPVTGREGMWGETSPAAVIKSVLVVGGGAGRTGSSDGVGAAWASGDVGREDFSAWGSGTNRLPWPDADPIRRNSHVRRG